MDGQGHPGEETFALARVEKEMPGTKGQVYT